MLPRYDTRATLQKLHDLIGSYRPERLICLGDSFHDTHAYARFDDRDKTMLHAMVHAVPYWYWVLGNHDPLLASELPGERHHVLQIQDVLLAHVPQYMLYWQIIGHFHPKLYAQVSGQRVSGPAFVKGDMHLIMPAFGSFTGGPRTDDAAITAIAGACTHYLMYRDKIWKI